uniref:Uncharacterized protein n=1 Tax=Entomoneis paludosa TaxID=265537 RepID=A0A7S2YNZ4_9STRA|mmetsp:Transcript_40393/g.84061  ORF Transcript_40393/g.84061 Transcript_40393/m.84061 type:complete len:241 (+) Transcript_40393:28-750(+)
MMPLSTKVNAGVVCRLGSRIVGCYGNHSCFTRAIGGREKEQQKQQRSFRTTTWIPKTAPTSNNQHRWSQEWKDLGLGAKLVDGPKFPASLFFVQLGFGVDQHGTDDATKAAIRAVRNAIEFNSIPGVISHLPGGRAEMLIHVKLGVPPVTTSSSSLELLPVDPLQVAKVFPYGKILPLEVVPGGLSFHTGRVVEELGDTNDVGVCVAACVTLGYDDPSTDDRVANKHGSSHTTYNTKDGY